MSSAKLRPFCLGLDVLMQLRYSINHIVLFRPWKSRYHDMIWKWGRIDIIVLQNLIIVYGERVICVMDFFRVAAFEFDIVVYIVFEFVLSNWNMINCDAT